MNTQSFANAIVSSAIQFMVAKSGATASEILNTIAADPKGNTSRYFADLISAAVRNADAISKGQNVSAESML